MHTTPSHSQELQDISLNLAQALKGSAPEGPNQVWVEGVSSHPNPNSNAQPGPKQAIAEAADPVLKVHPYLSSQAMQRAGVSYTLGQSVAALAFPRHLLQRCASKPRLDMCLTSPKSQGLKDISMSRHGLSGCYCL